MSLFTYKAVKAGGEEYEGTLNASTRFELYKHVRAEGGTVLSIKEGKGETTFNLGRLNAITERVRESEKITVARNLGAMIAAGLPLSRALSVVGRQTKNKKLKRIFGSIESDIQGGSNFHTALSQFPRTFSPLMISMVRAGEESGKLADSLSTVSEQMEKTYLLKRKIRGALIYPAIVITALLAVGALMLIYVVPVLSETFGELEVELPASTQFVINVSDFLTNNTLLALAILIVFVFLFVTGMRTEIGRRAFDFTLLHLPLVSRIVKDINTSRTARTFSSLLSSGVEVVSALGITRDVVQNSYFREVIEQAQKEVERGQSMAGVFEEHDNLYPILLSEMMAVGEETGKLPEMLSQIADFYENEVEQRTKNISTVIEPLLMIFVGAVVGFFALSMITPIYSLSSSI